MTLKEVELHIHVLQSLQPEDLFELAKGCYHEINWNRFRFLERYEKVFGTRLDPISLFDRAIKNQSLSEIEAINNYTFKGHGNFDEFDVKSFFPICITGYYFDKNDPYPVLNMITNRHKQEGIKYIEYRMGFGGAGAEWKKWHSDFARYFKNSSTDSFTAKYIVRLGNYQEFKEMIIENPDIVDTVVGVDFSGREVDPVKLKQFYQEINADRENNPKLTPDVVVHIGENFLDKSIESAIRFCHQSASFGAKRLAHCIALGIDPFIAIKRSPNAHLTETVETRINQIIYDLDNQDGLKNFGVYVDEISLKNELNELKEKEPNDVVKREYSFNRLTEISKRQDYVLNELKKLNTVIEVCPTSNLCIGGVPSISSHPLKKLFQSGVNLAICTDDPGIFATTLAKEVDFVLNQFQLKQEDFKDPYEFRLGKFK